MAVMSELSGDVCCPPLVLVVPLPCSESDRLWASLPACPPARPRPPPEMEGGWTLLLLRRLYMVAYTVARGLHTRKKEQRPAQHGNLLLLSPVPTCPDPSLPPSPSLLCFVPHAACRHSTLAHLHICTLAHIGFLFRRQFVHASPTIGLGSRQSLPERRSLTLALTLSVPQALPPAAGSYLPSSLIAAHRARRAGVPGARHLTARNVSFSPWGIHLRGLHACSGASDANSRARADKAETNTAIRSTGPSRAFFVLVPGRPRHITTHLSSRFFLVVTVIACASLFCFAVGRVGVCSSPERERGWRVSSAVACWLRTTTKAHSHSARA